MTETVHVAVDLNGRTTPAGLLHVDTRRTTSSTFTYDPGDLATAGTYPLDPALPLQGGAHHVRGLPGAFADAAPTDGGAT